MNAKKLIRTVVPAPLIRGIKDYRRSRLRESNRKFLDELRRRRPIIILGPTKCGTTAIAALLAHATGLSVTLDLQSAIHDLGWQMRVRYGLQDLSDFVAVHRDDFAKDIIKEPSLTFFYYDLKKLFPGAHFVMIFRNPLDMVRSNLNRLKIPGNLASIDFADWPELTRTRQWRTALDSTWLGRPSENYVAALANIWDLAAEIALAEQDQILILRYEDFQRDKPSFIADVAKQIGQAVTHDITHIMDKQYQRKGQSDVDMRQFFGSDNVALIKFICERNATRLGYAPEERW